ncbi:hypothetical protein ACFQVC_28200 [Streptomyces monticola]|uniref:Uncharacterized protein n=1 Tax=Streptomyces monticola TaxID=2666263 RepID=A0ABW2JPI9_9ACTN
MFERLVTAGRLRKIPWYAFHFAIAKPTLMYGQEPSTRGFGRPDNADDSELIAEIILNGLMA